MLISGAEVGRVEDTISRICYAYGAKKVDVLSMNNAIITTVELEDREVLTQTKRISGLHIDLDRLDRLNCLSRKICERRLPAEDIRKEFDGICQGKGYSFGVQLFASALISGAFAAFFWRNCKGSFGLSIDWNCTKVHRRIFSSAEDKFFCDDTTVFLFGRVACESGSDGSSGKSSGHDQPGQYYFVYTRSGFCKFDERYVFQRYCDGFSRICGIFTDHDGHGYGICTL